MSRTSIKCVVVGDGAVGKTCLMKTFVDDCFPEDYVPTVFDNYTTTMEVDGQCVDLGLWDTAGQEAYDRLRHLEYPQTDVFMLCFSLSDVSSFHNIRLKWYPEVRYYCPETPVVLVGTKSDLRKCNNLTLDRGHHHHHRSSDHDKTVSTHMGSDLKKEIGAKQFLECSALTQKGIKNVFEEVVRVALEPVHTKIVKRMPCSVT